MSEGQSLWSLAATGDREAQAAMVGLCLNSGLPEGPVAAEVFARLAASHGEAADCITLAAVLRLRAAWLANSDAKRSQLLASESDEICDGLERVPFGDGLIVLGTILSGLAEEYGDDGCASRLDALVSRLSPHDAARLRDSCNSVSRMILEHNGANEQ